MDKKISDLTATTLELGDQVEIYRPSAPASDLRAPLPVRTYQPVTAAAAIAAYAITRTSADILVRLTEDMNSDGTFARPSALVGDRLEIVRQGGGAGLWSLVGGDSSDVLRARDDRIDYQCIAAPSTWARVLPAGRDKRLVFRYSDPTLTLDGGWDGIEIWCQSACDVTLPANNGTRFHATLVQESADESIALITASGASLLGASPSLSNGVGDVLDVTVGQNASGNSAVYRVERRPLVSAATLLPPQAVAVLAAASPYTLDNSNRSDPDVGIVLRVGEGASAIQLRLAAGLSVGSWQIERAAGSTGAISIVGDTSAVSINGVAGPTNPGATVAVANDATVFLLMRGADVAITEGDTGEEQTLLAAVNANTKEIYGNYSPFQTATGSQAGAASARSWNLTGNVSAVPITNGWWAYYRASGGNRTIAPASGTCVKPDGTTQSPVTLGSGKRAIVRGDGTNLLVDGDVT